MNLLFQSSMENKDKYIILGLNLKNITDKDLK